ncbi:MAG TPA: class I SAM-dependent methyltransferase, partial [Planctomycetota bacterium]|nr:class I SAM-dependent methyltransferase [Planctomycetota bacterium]
MDPFHGSEALRKTKSFWDFAAAQNAHLAILWDDAMRDPAKSEAAFDEAARRDARGLLWFLHPESRVVDLGCGLGRLMRPLAPHCREIVGVDISTVMLDGARARLADLRNVRFLETDGGSLAGVEDGSVDFLFSLLCLIHVDKRAAYRYLLEIRRVLKPGARCRLQFHDLLTPEGFAKFRGIVRSDYPLEFYTEEELRLKLASAGLDPLVVERGAEYLYVTAVAGSAEAWKDAFARDVTCTATVGTGFFAGPTARLDAPGRLVVRLRSASKEARTLGTLISVTPRGAPPGVPGWFLNEGVAPLNPDGETELAFHYGGDGRTLELRVDGRPAPHSSTFVGDRKGGGPAELHVGLLPSGLYWNDDLLTRFPGFCTTTPITLEAPPEG